MPGSIDAISAAVRRATEQGFRDQLLAKGQARAMVWRGGRVPDGGPRFARGLSYDLLAYGYSLLTQGLRLFEGDGDHDLARTACAAAAEALEAVIANGPESPEADFHRLMAAGAYHIARYSARAFSLLTPFADAAAGNLAPVERALSLLMLRRLDRLDQLVIDWTTGDRTSDEALARQLADSMPADAWADAEAPDDQDPDDAASDAVIEVADLVLTQGFMVAASEALLALERGERSLLDRALEQFGVGLEDAGCCQSNANKSPLRAQRGSRVGRRGACGHSRSSGIGSRRTSSARRSGSISGSPSAFAMSRRCWPSAAST